MVISFIIIAYNAEKQIRHSLESLSNQSYPHEAIEVILVDGISNDNTKRIMLDFKERENSFRQIRIFDNPGKILACGWNVALKEAKGDVIIRVDAHTKFPSDFITKNIHCIESGENICGGRVVSILEEDSPLNRVLLEAENSMFGGGFTFFRRGKSSQYTNTLAFAAYRKEVFDRVGEYDERLVRTEDNEMHYRMRKAGFRFFFNPDIISYRYVRNSFSKLMNQKFLNGYWVGLTMSISPKAFSIFYFFPLLFVVSFVASIMFCYISYAPFIILMGSYLVVLIISFLAALKKNSFYKELSLLPLIIMCLHFVYGIGTIKGFVEIVFHKPFKMESNR